MTDTEFAARFADCTLPPAEFNHRGHVRIAWINLQRLPFGDAVRATCEGIRSYATSLGAATKFHWTITEALMHLLHAGGASDPSLPFEQFIDRNGPLLADARGRIALHYTDAALATDEARNKFIPPDLAPLPSAA
ncbi:MAG TPA: hypothetical protein VFT37_13665 [Telluria sp.]|nr:hypothetical protein [Telluria sp.]